MPTKEVFKQLAAKIARYEWDEQSRLVVSDANYEYIITQFQGTAFDSDYKCYKIFGKEWIPQGVIMSGKQVKVQLVAKISNIAEAKMLEMLRGQEFPVPFPVYALGIPNDLQTAMIFESFIPGRELFQVNTAKAWNKAIETIADFHLRYWNVSNNLSQWWENLGDYRNFSISHFNKKIMNAEKHAVFWNKALHIVEERLKTAPKTLVHGDLFPTNIIMNGNSCFLIDWADSGEFPYFLDLGRFTGIIQHSTEPMCKYESEVCNGYYEKMKHVLNISYEEFMRDVYMGQFIECANCFQPPHPIFGANNSKYNNALKNRLDILSDLIIA